MNTEKILKEMRGCYLKKDFNGLRRKYYLSKYFLKKEDREKIEAVIELERAKVIASAIKILDGKLLQRNVIWNADIKIQNIIPTK